MDKKIIYVDLDGVVADYADGCKFWKLDAKRAKRISGFFSSLYPIKGAVDALRDLINCGKYEIFILSTSPWSNSSALTEKLEWVKGYLPEYFYKRVIFSHHKNLNIGDYLIDDSTRNGAAEFTGEHIHFGSERFPDWKAVLEYLI